MLKSPSVAFFTSLVIDDDTNFPHFIRHQSSYWLGLYWNIQTLQQLGNFISIFAGSGPLYWHYGSQGLILNPVPVLPTETSCPESIT
jgi:hypothetical protein